MRLLLKLALAALLGWISPASAGGSLPDFRLRTLPVSPRAGQEFAVLADGTPCTELFLQDPIGTGQVYSQVTTSAGVIRVQVGYRLKLPCENEPNTVLLVVPGLPVGSYRIELLGRPLFAPGTGTDFLQAIDVSIVAPNSTGVAPVPIHGWTGVLVLVALIAGIGAIHHRPELATRRRVGVASNRCGPFRSRG